MLQATPISFLVREEKWYKVLQSRSFQDRLFGLITGKAHVVPGKLEIISPSDEMNMEGVKSEFLTVFG